MTVALIGGLDRLAPHYTAIADEHENVTIKVFSRFRPGLSDRIASADGVILCTDLISHKAAREVYRLARANEVELVCTHRSSVSAIRKSVAELARSCGCARPCPGCTGGCGCGGASKSR